MIDGYKVVSVTPAGRRRFVEILAAYLLAERGLIDRHEWWVNTDVPEDVAYLEEISWKHPGFFQTVTSPSPVPAPDKRSYRICEWGPRLTDPDTIYVRIDDDIVYMAPGAMEKLLRFRVQNPKPFLVYPAIVNNSVISHLQQRQGAIPHDFGNCNYDVFGLGWKSGPFAEMVHRSFLKALQSGEITKWQFGEWHLTFYERVSVNCITWFGKDFAEFGGNVDRDEEQFLSCVKPAALKRPNAVFGQSLMAHFSYYTQIAHMDGTDILEQYRRLALNLSRVPVGVAS